MKKDLLIAIDTINDELDRLRRGKHTAKKMARYWDLKDARCTLEWLAYELGYFWPYEEEL